VAHPATGLAPTKWAESEPDHDRETNERNSGARGRTDHVADKHERDLGRAPQRDATLTSSLFLRAGVAGTRRQGEVPGPSVTKGRLLRREDCATTIVTGAACSAPLR
jgi:hypothetical protein